MNLLYSLSTIIAFVCLTIYVTKAIQYDDISYKNGGLGISTYPPLGILAPFLIGIPIANIIYSIYVIYSLKKLEKEICMR